MSSKLTPWSVTSSHLILADRWITLRADSCVTSAGHVIAPYYVLEYPDWVHVVALNENGEILLTQQYRHGAQKILWELPAGGVEKNDDSPLAAARRELLEECGCVATSWTLLNSLYANPANQVNRIHVYLASGVTHERPPANDPSERIVCKWMPPQEVLSLIDGMLFGQALHVCSLFLGLRRRGVSL